MKAVYFAWVRERIGLSEEEIAPPREVATVRQLIDWLSARGDGYAAAFAHPGDDPRRDRQGPRRSERADRRGPRNRLLPADDGRLRWPRRSRRRRCASRRRTSTRRARRRCSTHGRRDVGALVSFTGLCRDEDGALAALELEHYPGMAEAEIAPRRGARR